MGKKHRRCRIRSNGLVCENKIKKKKNEKTEKRIDRKTKDATLTRLTLLVFRSDRGNAVMQLVKRDYEGGGYERLNFPSLPLPPLSSHPPNSL